MIKTLTDNIAIRSNSIDYFAIGSMYLPNPDPVLKAQGKDIKIYNDLRIDDRVSGSMSNRFNASLALDWQIDKGKSGNSRQAKVIQEVFDKLPLNRIMGEILQARSFGYAPLEVIWGVSDGLTVPLNVVLKPQSWFVFGPENDLRFRSRDNMMTGDELPPYKFLCPTNEASYEDPYGLGLLSRCFWPVVFKKGGWRFWIQFSEKYGQIWPLGKLPRGAAKEQQSDMLDLLSSMVQDGVGVIPDDGSIEFKESATKGATSDLYRGIIAEANSAISTVWLGHAGAGESVAGQLGGKDTASEVRTDLRDADKTLIEETLNQLIKWICEVNWKIGSDTPLLSIWEEEEVDGLQAIRDKDLSESLSRSGLKLSKGYYLREYNLEDGDIEESENPPQPPFNKGGAFKNPPPPNHPPLGGGAFAEPTDTLTQLANHLSSAADKPMTEWINQLRVALTSAADLSEMQAEILSVFPGLPVTEMARILAEESIRANMSGRLE